MADSFIQLNNDGPGKKVDTRTESTNGDHRQVMVIGDPTTNANVANVSASGAVQVDGSGVTQPVSLSGNVTVIQPTGTNLHTVIDSGTAIVTQATGTNLHTVVDSGTVTISGTSPISGTVTANQGTPNTLANGWPVELSDGTNLLGVTAHPVRVDPTGTTTQPVSGTVTANAGTGTMNVSVQNASIPVTESGTWTVQPGNTANTTPWLSTINQGGNSAIVDATGDLQVDVNNFPATQTVAGTVTANQGTANATPWNENIAQIAGSTTSTAAAGVIKTGITGSTAATLDAVITAATAPANALATLSVNNTTPPSLTTGQSVALQSDYEGSLFVKPYRRAQTTAKATTIAASAAATTVLAAQAAGIFADISTLVITPTGAATATVFTCTLSDGTNSYIFDMDTGTTAGAAGQGVNITFNPPLPATTAATAWTIANSSATPTVHITVVAVLQKAS